MIFKTFFIQIGAAGGSPQTVSRGIHKADFQKYPRHIFFSCSNNPKHNILGLTSGVV